MYRRIQTDRLRRGNSLNAPENAASLESFGAAKKNPWLPKHNRNPPRTISQDIYVSALVKREGGLHIQQPTYSKHAVAMPCYVLLKVTPSLSAVGSRLTAHVPNWSGIGRLNSCLNMWGAAEYELLWAHTTCCWMPSPGLEYHVQAPSNILWPPVEYTQLHILLHISGHTTSDRPNVYQ